MPRLNSLLASAHELLNQPLPEVWPVQLMQHIDGLTTGAEDNTYPPLPSTPFRNLRIEILQRNPGQRHICIHDGDLLLLGLLLADNGERLAQSILSVYIPWRSRGYGPRRKLLVEALARLGITLEITSRQSGEFIQVAYLKEESGKWTWEEWPCKHALVLAKNGQGSKVQFVEPVSRWH